VVLTGGAPAPGGVPGPALAGASDGQTAWVVRPDRLGGFLRIHASAQLVCPNAGELHRVLHAHLVVANEAAAQQALSRFVAEGRLVDVSLLDLLLRLDEDGCRRPPRLSLQQLAWDRAGVALPVEDELRQAIASAPDPDAALAAQAVCQVEAVVKVFAALWGPAHAAGLAVTFEGQQRSRFPSLAVQVQADVALAHARHHGLHLSAQALQKVVAACLDAQRRDAARLAEDPEASRCFKAGPGNKIIRQPGDRPEVRRGTLVAWLTRMLASVKGLHATDFASPIQEDSRVSADPEDWGALARCDPLLRAWSELMTVPDVARSCASAAASALRPRYEVLPRTHSSGPDLSALRRLGGPGLFRPAQGHKFLVVELRHLELRALAAVCLGRWGQSRLADIFIQRQDPYDCTAAGLARLAPADFAALRASDPPAHDRWLRLARALLAAAPMGFSAEGVREIARSEFGLDDLGLAEAHQLHGRLLHDVLPELGEYLHDDTVEALAGNLMVAPGDLHGALVCCRLPHGPSLPELRGWFRWPERLPADRRDQLLILLRVWNANEALRPLITKQVFDFTLYVALFGRRVTTLSGRVRGRALFAEARQAVYLDLADDAAKAALFALAAGGLQAAAFADDTVVVEVPDAEGSGAEVSRAEGLARQAAEGLLGGVPALCEARLLEEW
jgi:hypothetical protein